MAWRPENLKAELHTLVPRGLRDGGAVNDVRQRDELLAPVVEKYKQALIEPLDDAIEQGLAFRQTHAVSLREALGRDDVSTKLANCTESP